MRQTRRLALMLAAQFIPFAAYAQTAPTNPPAAAGANQDDEDSEEEESSSSASTEEAPEETPADDAAAETDDARRTRILPRFSTLDGSIGLLHTAAAQLGGAGSFRFGLTGEFSSSTGFLRPSALSATALVGGEDDARHVGGTLTLSYSPLDFLEVFGSVRAYANANNRERPSLFQVLGDSNLGVKAAFRVHRGIYVGGDLAVFLLNRSGDVGLNFDSTSFQIRALGTLDLQELTRTVPLRVHLNARYYFDNSAAIVSDVESRRRAAQPGFDPAICATTNDPRCFLEVSRIERYALGVNRTDQLGINVAVDANLPYVNPFLEWSVGIPVNRQGYQCYLAPSSGTRPGGAADDDGCLDQEGFSAVPSRLTIGARVLPPVRGLSGTLAVDIATSGSSTFVRELAPTTPWQIFFGAAFAYDIHAPERRVEVPGPERIVNRDVDRTPPGGTVNGTVRDAESHSGVNHAIVTFTGHPELHILASAADGTFRSGHIPPGDYRVHVEADGYNPNDCNFTIPAPAAPAAPAGDANAAAAPAAAPAPVVVTSQCELRPLPRRGTLTGHVVSSQGGAGVGNATVTLTPAQGAQQGATEQTATTDAQGNFTISDVLAGPYTVSVGATPQHMATTPQAVTVEARRSVNVDITATRRPARPSAVLRGGVIAVTRQIHFQVNSAEILPDSTTLVEEIADVIRRNPTLTAIEIQGHTDNTGVPANNLTLSQSRADSVRDALVRLGIPADKLTARGFGQTRPVRPNITAAGRAANRRVEFHVTRAR